MELTFRKDMDAKRYEVLVDGALASFTEYLIDGDRVVMAHTVTTPAFRGKGLASKVVRYALDDIKPTGRTVVPSCWFVADFIDAHDDYRALRAH